MDKHEQLLVGMVMQYQQLAMMALGKLARPEGGLRRDLQEASFFIDILDALSHKTEGNMSDDAKRFLESALSDLRLNFVDESAKPEPAPKEEDNPVETSE